MGFSPTGCALVQSSKRTWLCITAECWLVDKWVEIDQETILKFIGNGRSVKTYRMKSTDSDCSSTFHSFNTRFSYLYVITSLSSMAGWWTNSNTSTSGPQACCSTHFVHCLYLTTELTAGRQAVPGVKASAIVLSLLNYKTSIRLSIAGVDTDQWPP